MCIYTPILIYLHAVYTGTAHCQRPGLLLLLLLLLLLRSGGPLAGQFGPVPWLGHLRVGDDAAFMPMWRSQDSSQAHGRLSWTRPLLALLGSLTYFAHAARDNILFIATDDMRPELSPYGHRYMRTPNLQALADETGAFTFRRAYVQQALCAPSRTVILTGRRPDSSRVWAIGPYFRDTTLRHVVTLPQFFKQHGYRAIGHGKIFRAC